MAALAADFKTDGWQVKVDGLVDKPRSFTTDQLHALSKPQERIYRMRCVEGWSMVIPWVGVPLAHLLEAVIPQTSAKYVAFETLLDADRMPGQRSNILQWPYVEGLRLDEAMHPLTILATGLYRKSTTTAGWCANSPGCASEVWIQGYQVDRAYQPGR